MKRSAAAYAADTDVSPERSRAEIEATVQRYGATAFLSAWEQDRQIIMFEAHGRRVQFILPLPQRREFELKADRTKYSTEQGDLAYQKAIRQRWRALALVIKAKLEAVASGIVTFDDEFLAHMVLPDGRTLGEKLGPRLAEITSTGRLPPLLPGPSCGD